MRKPRIVITNFTQGDMTEDDIQVCIANQNQFKDEEVKVKYVSKSRAGQRKIYCECSAAAFSSLMSRKKVYIGWERYPVYEDLSVLRCYKCQAYNHKMDSCNGETVCPKCNGNHREKDCASDKYCCCNCIISNRKYGCNRNTDHAANDSKCPTLEYYRSIVKSKIDYTCNG